MIARIVTMLLGTWVLVSGLAFRGGTISPILVLVGALILAFEIFGIFRKRFRFLDTALGAVLVLSAFVFATARDELFWSALISGVLIAVLSMVRGHGANRTWMPGTEIRRRADVR